MSSAGATSRGPVLLALAVALIAISFAAIFFRLAQPTHPLVMSATRLTIASLLWAPLVWRGARRRRFGARHARWAALGGALYAVHFGAWVWSLTLTSVAASVTLVTATPLLLAVLGTLTGRDRPSARLWAALALASVGIVTIGWSNLSASPDALRGDALALLGAAAMALYFLAARHLGESLDVWAFSGVACAVGAALLWLGAAAAGAPLTVSSWEAFGYLFLAAAIPQMIGHTLLTWSLRHVTPTTAGVATLGEPVGAGLLGWLILGESISPIVAAGCVVTLSAVALALRAKPAA